MIHVHKATLEYQRMKYEDFTDENGRTRSRQAPDGPAIRYAVHMEIDIDGIMAEWGREACRNKSKRSKCLGGLVKITAVPLPGGAQ